MNCRQDQRLTIPLHTWLYLDNKLLIKTAARNVSRYGLYLHITHHELKCNTIVDIEVLDNIEQYCWRGRALIIHTSSQGIGILLEEQLPLTFFRHRSQTRLQYKQH